MIIRQKKSVISHLFDGIAYIVEPNGKTVRVLNETASFLWEGAKRPISVSELSQRLMNSYKVSKEKALSDVQRFTREYLKAGLFEEFDRSSNKKH